MRTIKKLSILGLVCFTLILIFQAFPIVEVQAATDSAAKAALKGFKDTADVAGLQPEPSPFIVIGRILGYVTGIGTVILLIIVVYGGLTWMTAGGNEEAVSKGRKMIIHGVIGLLVTMSAYSLVYYVTMRVMGGNVGAFITTSESK